MNELFKTLYQLFSEMIEKMTAVKSSQDEFIREIFPNLTKISSVYVNKDNLQVYGDWRRSVQPDFLGRIIDPTEYGGNAIKFSDMTDEQITALKKYYCLETELKEYEKVLSKFRKFFAD